MSSSPFVDEETAPLARPLDLVAATRAHRVVIAVSMVAGLISALAVTGLERPPFTSTASVVVRLPPTTAATAPAPPNMATEKQIASSLAVASEALERDPRLDQVGGTEELRDALEVDVPVDTEILRFTFSSHEQWLAQAGARATAEAYLGFRSSQLRDTAAELEATESRIRELKVRRRHIEARAQAMTDPVLGSVLAAEAGAITTQISSLEQQVTTIQERGDSVGGLVGPPSPAVRPGMGRYVVPGILGVLVGGAVGLLCALLIDGLAERRRRPQDAADILGARFLGTVPVVEADWWRHLALVDSPTGSDASEVRRTATKLLGLQEGGGSRSIAFFPVDARTSSTQSTFVADLGIALAGSGRQVIIVSATLDATIERLFEIDGSRSVSHAAGNGRPHPEDTPVRGLRVLTLSSDGDVVLDPVRLRPAWEAVRRAAKVVIVDAPPLDAVQDPGLNAILRHTDGVVVTSDVRVGEASLLRARSTLRNGGVEPDAVLSLKGKPYRAVADLRSADDNLPPMQDETPSEASTAARDLA